MMMAALVCFFGKNNALQPFPVYYFFVILVSFAFSRSVGSVFFVQPLTTCFASCFTFYRIECAAIFFNKLVGELP